MSEKQSVAAQYEGGNDVYRALQKFWRSRRGLSQLDLALAADVSSRHISFLETGRAQPSRDMVLRLAAAMSIPLRDQNALLRAAGFEPAFAEPAVHGGLAPGVELAIGSMMKQHEPFPLVVMSTDYDVLRLNDGAQRLMGQMVLDPTAFGARLNVLEMLFNPRLSRSFVTNWEQCARETLLRLHRNTLANPNNGRLSALLERLLAYDDVPVAWRTPDLSEDSLPTFTVFFERGEHRLAFLTTTTVFTAPQNVTLEETIIESYFPLDAETDALWRRLSQGA